MNRIVIYPKDISIILGVSLPTARKILREVRAEYQKPQRSMVTVGEFCKYKSLPYQEILQAINK